MTCQVVLSNDKTLARIVQSNLLFELGNNFFRAYLSPADLAGLGRDLAECLQNTSAFEFTGCDGGRPLLVEMILWRVKLLL